MSILRMLAESLEGWAIILRQVSGETVVYTDDDGLLPEPVDEGLIRRATLDDAARGGAFTTSAGGVYHVVPEPDYLAAKEEGDRRQEKLAEYQQELETLEQKIQSGAAAAQPDPTEVDGLKTQLREVNGRLDDWRELAVRMGFRVARFDDLPEPIKRQKRRIERELNESRIAGEDAETQLREARQQLKTAAPNIRFVIGLAGEARPVQPPVQTGNAEYEEARTEISRIAQEEGCADAAGAEHQPVLFERIHEFAEELRTAEGQGKDDVRRTARASFRALADNWKQFKEV